MNRITVCHDCCCGTRKKHPGVDHDYLLDLMRHGTEGHAAVRISDCLDACEHSNVVVVSPAPGHRQDKGKSKGRRVKPVWLSGILTDDLAEAVVGWVVDGGPGVADLPDALRHRVVKPPSG